MKQIIFILCSVISTLSFAQTQEGVRHQAPPPPPSETIYDQVEKKAEFPLGLNTFRQMISDNVDLDNLYEIESDVQCNLFFTIEKDGTMTDIKAVGNNDAFNKEAVIAISKIKERWNPAYLYGSPVRSRWKVPISLNFEEDDPTATFPYGIDDFRNRIRKNLNFSKIKGEDQKCEIFFDVESNGTISKIQILGDNKSLNKEVKKAISKIKIRWNPPIKNGIASKSSLMIPFEIENSK